MEDKLLKKYYSAVKFLHSDRDEDRRAAIRIFNEILSEAINNSHNVSFYFQHIARVIYWHLKTNLDNKEELSELPPIITDIFKLIFEEKFQNKFFTLNESDIPALNLAKINLCNYTFKQIDFNLLQGSQIQMNWSEFSNTNFERATMPWGKFNESKFYQSKIVGSQVKWAEFKRSDFNESEINDSNFEGAILLDSKWNGIQVKKSKLNWVDAAGMRINNSVFRDVDFLWANFRHSIWTDCELVSSNLENCIFDQAIWKSMVFSACRFYRVDFSQVDINGSIEFKSCNLSKSSFQGINISQFVFENCNLSGVNFKSKDKEKTVLPPLHILKEQPNWKTAFYDLSVWEQLMKEEENRIPWRQFPN